MEGRGGQMQRSRLVRETASVGAATGPEGRGGRVMLREAVQVSGPVVQRTAAGEQVRRGFVQATELAHEVLRRPEVARRWTAPSALAGMSVGGVAAHLGVVLRRLEVALDETPPPSARKVPLAVFYGANRFESPADRGRGLHALLVEDAERRAQDGPRLVAARFHELTGRLLRRIETEDDGRLVPVIQVRGGVTSLLDYLRSRVVELVVHADDLATSAHLPSLSLPEVAGTVAVDALVEMARDRSGLLAVVRTFARRERADPDAVRVF